MIRSPFSRSLPAILGAFVIASCSDAGVSGPTAPADAIAGTSSEAALKAGSTDASHLELRALRWKKQHKNLPSMSQWIERSGGTISIPETGFTMTFPEGAVTTRIRITVTADEKYVAYKMEPAGTQFSKEVPLSQSLAATELTGHALRRRLFAVLASG